jgi:hypothetical protein
MEEIKPTMIFSRMPRVKIYFEDLENIIRILETEKSSKISLIYGNKLFDFTEIDKLNVDRVSSLEIRASYPNYLHVSITLDEDGVKIYCSENTTQMQGVVKQIEDTLKSKLRFLSSFTKTILFRGLFGSIIGVALYFNILGIYRAFKNTDINPLFLFGWILTSILFWFFSFLDYNKTIVFLKSKNSYQNIFARNRDQIFVGLFVGIPSAVFGAIIGFLIAKIIR